MGEVSLQETYAVCVLCLVCGSIRVFQYVLSHPARQS